MGISNDIQPRKHSRFSDHAKPSHELPVIENEPEEVKIKTSEKSPEPEPKKAKEEIAEKKVEEKTEEKAPSKVADFESFFDKTPKTKETQKSKAKSIPEKSLFERIFNRWLLLFLLVFALSLLAFQNFEKIKDFYNTQTGKEDGTGGNITQTVKIVPQDYSTGTTTAPATTGSTAQTTTPITAPAQTTTPATVTTTAKSAIKLKLLNGNGITGSANTIKKTLEADGYVVGFLGNAKVFTYQSTYIYYKTAFKTNADAIKLLFPTRTIIEENNEAICGTYDIVMVVGKK